MTAKKLAQTEPTNFSMPEKYFPFGSNDLAPCSAFCTSPAQANHLAGFIPYQIETRINRFFLPVKYQEHINTSDHHHKDYLLHIHPTHAIW